MDFDCELDTSGLNCPHPILRAKKALFAMESGKILRVLATDPGSRRDFQDFAEQTGNTLLAASEENGLFEYFLRRR